MKSFLFRLMLKTKVGRQWREDLAKELTKYVATCVVYGVPEEVAEQVVNRHLRSRKHVTRRLAVIAARKEVALWSIQQRSDQN